MLVGVWAVGLVGDGVMGWAVGGQEEEVCWGRWRSRARSQGRNRMGAKVRRAAVNEASWSWECQGSVWALRVERVKGLPHLGQRSSVVPRRSKRQGGGGGRCRGGG